MASSVEVLVRRCTHRLEQQGHRSQPLLRTHDIELAERPDPLARLHARNEEALLRDAERLADDPLLGWWLGDFELRDLGVYGYTALNSSDVRSALAALVELLPLVSENARFELHEADGEATLAQTLSTGRCTDQVSLRVLLCHLRELIGPDFVPLRLGLPEDDPDRLEALRKVSGLPVVTAEQRITFVTFRSSLLDRPVHGADLMLARTLRRLWEEEKPRLAARIQALLRLEDAIVPLLPSGEPTLDRVADELGIAERVLRAELKALGLSLPGVTDIVRANLVGGLLAEPGMTLERASRALGYGDTAPLMRAHQRWRGVPPVLGRGLGEAGIG